MATRIESIVWGPAPAGAVVDHAVLTVTGALGSIQEIQVGMLGTFIHIDLAADSYTASVQAVDAAGNQIGAAVIDTFVITVPVTAYFIPVSMTGVTE
jgi:YbbR domain-containing protein